MEVFQRFKAITVAVVTALGTAIGYETEALTVLFPELPRVVISLAVGAAGGGIGFFVAAMLLSSRRMRSFIAGSENVEGYYLLRTGGQGEKYDPEVQSSAMLFEGILHLEYDPTAEQFRVHTVRLDSDGLPFSTHSVIAYIRREGTYFRYLNYFKITHGSTSIAGISHGEIVRNESSSPNHLTAQIFCEDTKPRRQTGTKFSMSEVKKNKKVSGALWTEKLLLERRRSLPSLAEFASGPDSKLQVS